MDTSFFNQLNSESKQIQKDSNIFTVYNTASLANSGRVELTDSALVRGSVEVNNVVYIPVKESNSNLYFSALVLDMILLIVILGLYRNHFFYTVRALFSSKDYQQIESKSSIIKHPLIVILFSMFIVNISLLIGVYANQFLGFYSNEALFYLAIGLLGFYISKIIIVFFSAQIFDMSNVGRIYIDFLLISFSFLAVFFSLILWFDIYVGGKLFYGFSLVIIGLISLVRIFRTYRIIIPKSAFSPFHFFLYLCTVEILPLIVLGKLVMQGIL